MKKSSKKSLHNQSKEGMAKTPKSGGRLSKNNSIKGSVDGNSIQNGAPTFASVLQNCGIGIGKMIEG